MSSSKVCWGAGGGGGRGRLLLPTTDKVLTGYGGSSSSDDLFPLPRSCSSELLFPNPSSSSSDPDDAEKAMITEEEESVFLCFGCMMNLSTACRPTRPT
jgi:hypothetical protein